MNVPALPPLEMSDWEAINAAFQHAPSWNLGQAWRDQPQENFRPGTVRIGCHCDAMLILAVLKDDCIFTTARADHERLWLKGDVFEIFFRDVSQDEYWELHVTPNGHRLQLRFPSVQTVSALRKGQGNLVDYVVRDSVFDFNVRTTREGWDVCARIPVRSGRDYLASFSRYDYADENAKPVLSSTSAHSEMDFHRQQEWKTLSFQN